MIKSISCHYSGAFIQVTATITVLNTAPAAVSVNNANKKVIFLIGPIQDIHMVIPMYSLIKYSNIYCKRQEVYGNTEEMKL